MTDRRFLTIVRAGNGSLHPDWLAGRGSRSWDIVVSYYGDDPDRFRAPDVTRIDSKGPKWPALHTLLQAHPELIARYDYIWLPDDDLATDMDTINRLFATCAALRLEAAQPSLTWDSYSTHLVTLRHENTLLRFTNFVEVMAPCLSSAMLARALPFFAENISGWGIDFMWSKLADDPQRGIAVLDTLTVRHTRPIGGPNYRILRERDLSPLVELRAFCKKHDIDPKIVTHLAIDRHGRLITANRHQRLFDLRLLVGCLAAMRQSPDRGRVVRRMCKLIARTVTQTPYRIVDLNATSL
jgi:Protein of unknown function (DUF707)